MSIDTTKTDQNDFAQNEASATGENFQPGSTVIYGLMGKCQILGIETKTVGGQSMSFYKLEPIKMTFAKPKRPEPNIWAPVATAKKNGLRAPMTKADFDKVMEIFEDREYYFSPDIPFKKIQPDLEKAIIAEGAIGMAKVLSYLHVLKNRQIVPGSELIKFHENVHKIMVRELTDIFEEPIKAVEARLEKAMSQKLIPDN